MNRIIRIRSVRRGGSARPGFSVASRARDF